MARTRHRVVRFTLAAALVVTSFIMPTASVGTDTGSALLPDLVMLQPGDFRLERKPGGVRWLRFSTIIANTGDGPFDVYGYEPNGADITQKSTLRVRQRIVESVDSAGNRTWSEHEAVDEHGTPSTMFYSGDGHDHWHVLGLQEWRLAFEKTPDGTLETGAKTGFCFWDNVDLGWAMPKDYSGTWACHVDSTGTRVPMGQAVGWGDEYPSTIAGQYIDITGYPYGNYCLTLVADPRGEFIEMTTTNNTVRTLISIQTSGVTVLAQDCGEPDTTAPEAPTGLTATPGDQKVVLYWEDNQEADLSGYKVYRGGAYLTSVSSSTYTDGSLQNGTEYCYAISAVDASGNESTRTSPVCATPAAGIAATTVHVADLDGSQSVQGKSGRWEALVTVTVVDGTGAPVDGATVSGTWAGAASGTATGTTSAGTVTLSSGTLTGGTSATLTISGIVADGATYDSESNTDPDQDSDGTTITVSK